MTAKESFLEGDGQSISYVHLLPHPLLSFSYVILIQQHSLSSESLFCDANGCMDDEDEWSSQENCLSLPITWLCSFSTNWRSRSGWKGRNILPKILLKGGWLFVQQSSTFQQRWVNGADLELTGWRTCFPGLGVDIPIQPS